MQTYTAHSVEDTWRIARDVAALLVPGTVMTLTGVLGAGKTTFTQGLAAALGVKRPVTSPTFTISCEYPTQKVLLVHMDLYRLTSPDDVLAVGWYDYLERGAALVVEWADRAGDLIPSDAVRVTLALGDTPESRIITVAKECV